MRVQQELDETKIVLVRFKFRPRLMASSKDKVIQHKTIESVLQRGEKLDNLVDRSNALSAQSKMFYKTAKKVCTSLRNLARVGLNISAIAKFLLCNHVNTYSNTYAGHSFFFINEYNFYVYDPTKQQSVNI